MGAPACRRACVASIASRTIFQEPCVANSGSSSRRMTCRPGVSSLSGSDFGFKGSFSRIVGRMREPTMEPRTSVSTRSSAAWPGAIGPNEIPVGDTTDTCSQATSGSYQISTLLRVWSPAGGHQENSNAPPGGTLPVMCCHVMASWSLSGRLPAAMTTARPLTPGTAPRLFKSLDNRRSK